MSTRALRNEPPAAPTVPIAGRIEAVVAAMDLYRLLRDEKGADMVAPWTIVAYLKDYPVKLDAIRGRLDAILAQPLEQIWSRGWVRLYVGVIEAALGFAHSPSTQAALDARAGDSQQWSAFLATFDDAVKP